jgi:diamine N-acetyltransferase
MFFYTTLGKFRFPLDVLKLSENQSWLNQAAVWTEKKWGYIRGYPGLEKRKELLSKLQNDFYIVMYGKHAVGMFFLLDYPSFNKNRTTPNKELMYFYVDESFRGLGIGGRMLKMAKKMAADQGGEMMILDTLNPNLNKFYEKHGAKIICDSQFLGHPTTELRIGLK